ncbi:hypothetical protein B0H17DRAFT_270091 [Mycena rosella]|uniref:C3H1-type domain-containing protein n=1 Tax=Mycena rosella TaxID=1033263 RepID=A0AAD7DVF8_MYCRO|nr:hypothetical protein B0H17DRAFT_270091 [Mycena rosella]
MATQPMGEASAASQKLQWDDTLSRLLHLSDVTVQRNQYLEGRAVELETEVVSWRQAYNAQVEDSERRVKAYQMQVSALNRQISKQDFFQTQNAVMLCVVNGDRILFNGSLLAQGHHGGASAAQGLTKTIADHLSSEELTAFKRLSFWITVYFNRGRLLDTLVGNNICSVQQFDAFLAGFSKCSTRFSLVDVGTVADTDAKIQEYIQTHARFPQTLRVFLAGTRYPTFARLLHNPLAGGHDSSQYASMFDALQSEQLLGKLVMLAADGDTGSVGNLPLRFLRVDGIFMNPLQLQLQRTAQQKPGPLSVSCVPTNGGLMSPQSPASHTSGRSGRAIDPSLPLHKQNPPPCNEHYLMTCSKQPASCKYSHEYTLTQEQLASLASNAKKAPCNYLKNGMACPYGAQCCWGHFCPQGPRCFHLSKGKCWFKGETMHLEASSDSH